MTSVIKNAGPKLIPFFKTVAIYFVVFIPHSKPGLIAAFLKCMPVISLMIFVLWYGKHIHEESKSFARKIFFGLLFSCFGDFFLVWPELFTIGMVMFAIGHVCYIMAFGLKPLNLPMGIVISLLTLFANYHLMPGLTGVLVPGVPIYSMILSVMMWRGISRLESKKDFKSISHICAAIGSILFMLSDLLLGLNKFKFEIPNQQVFVMATYYAAQFGISLSVIDFPPKERTN